MQESLVDYLSYSSMSQLMRNPLAFKKKYVLKIYDDIMSPSSVVGQAGHKALEHYYNGAEIAEAVEKGLEYINNISDTGIDYGKTGSRENILKTYTQAIGFYFEELPKYHEILGVELKVQDEIDTIDGQKLPLPAKGFMDLVTRNKLGEIEIVDHKFVRGYADGSVDDFGKFLQGMFNYHLVLKKFGEAPKRIIFNECKVSKNKNNEPQIQPYTIEFEGIYGDFATFYKLFNDVVKVLQDPNYIFLPNPSDIFDGQNSFEVYRSGVIGVERPTAVKHKTEQKTFVEKNFVPSVPNKVGNEQFTNEEKIYWKLQEFAAPVEMQETFVGPSVTKYTLKPSKGVSMAKISKLDKDLALALEAKSIRIEAPIRGTSLVGIEVPSAVRKKVDLAENHLKKGTLDIPIGVDVYGKTIYKAIDEMPHLLIAGATGSGKSVMLNVLLTALTKQMKPEGLELILVDPKRVELSQFAKVPHLAMPVVYEIEEATQVIDYVVEQMEERYSKLAAVGARSLSDYKGGDIKKLVVVIDEFADLMLNGGTDKRVTKVIDGYGPRGGELSHIDEKPSIETQIVRIAQKARAVGIHLVLATQRPSADVVTGLLKANIPTKIAFMTTNAVNSKIILDVAGAEELTGKGDMLFLDPDDRELKRLQGLYA